MADTQAESRIARFARLFALGSAIASIATCLIVLLCWVAGVWRIVAVGSGFIPMPPSTACLLLLLGICLFVLHRGAGVLQGSRFIYVTLLVVIAVSLGVLLAPDSALESRVLRLAGVRPDSVSGVPVGLMSPVTACLLILTSVALLLRLPSPGGAALVRRISSLLSALLIAVSGVVILSYAADVPLFYDGRTIPVALLTGVVFVLLNFGIFISVDPSAWPLSLLRVRQAQGGSDLPVFFRTPLPTFLVMTACVGCIAFFYLKHQMIEARNSASTQLQTIADVKAAQIAGWYSERMADATVMKEMPWLGRDILMLKDPEHSGEARARILTMIQSLHRFVNYKSIALFDEKGALLLSAPAGAKVAGYIDHEGMPLINVSSPISVLDLHTNKFQQGGVSMDFCVPVYVRGDTTGREERVGLIMLEVEPYFCVQPGDKSWPGASRTAETLLVRREGQDVVFLSRRRHAEGGPLEYRIPIDFNPTVPAVLAASGVEGEVEGPDYRNVPVLAAIRKVPETPWMLIAKIDHSEVFLQLRKDALTTGIVLLVLIVAIAFGMDFVWSKRDSYWMLQQLAASKRSRDELAREQRFTYGVLESIADGVVACNEEGRLVLFNKAARLWHGMDAIDVPPEEWALYFSLFEADGKTPLATESIPLVRAFKGEFVRNAGMAIVAKGQPPRFVLASGGPLIDANGAKVGAVVAMHDITSNLKSEAALRARSDELARSNAELEQFAYVASHDLQEPLRMVASYTQLLAKRYKGRFDKDADDFMNYAVDGATRMQRLITDLLAYSRINTRGTGFEPVDSHTALGRAVANLAWMIEENRAVVTNGELPVVAGDGTQIAQVFQNLIQNAIKFSGDGLARVHISAAKDGDLWVFSVKDSGIGIAKEYQARLFQLFVRLHSRKDYAGTGIGLALCRRIVERHGGKIWVESDEGKGATFFFSLPAAGEQ